MINLRHPSCPFKDFCVKNTQCSRNNSWLCHVPCPPTTYLCVFPPKHINCYWIIRTIINDVGHGCCKVSRFSSSTRAPPIISRKTCKISIILHYMLIRRIVANEREKLDTWIWFNSIIKFFLLFSLSDFTNAQTKRNQSPRAGPTGRALGLNPKTSSSSSSSEFSCPEEFGYFPHPSDCSLYYVCVFGGALLESCTGGLMYSHELQTCDWPRNVGCEVREIAAPVPQPPREVTPRVPAVSSRVRFSSLPQPQEELSGPSGPSGPSAPAHIQQIQTLPPPPDQHRISPNPVITSRGQPKSFSQDEILKVNICIFICVSVKCHSHGKNLLIYSNCTQKLTICHRQLRRKKLTEISEFSVPNLAQWLKFNVTVTESSHNRMSTPFRPNKRVALTTTTRSWIISGEFLNFLMRFLLWQSIRMRHVTRHGKVFFEIFL